MNILSPTEKKREEVKDIVKNITSNNDADTVIMSNRKKESNNNDWRQKLKHDTENIEKLTNNNYDMQYQHDGNKVMNCFILDV